MIAFGSCNKQNKAQDYWLQVAAHEPSHFLWTGDAVYTKSRDVGMLQQAYRNQTSNENYSRFSSSVLVDGVWDDHDYGVNDAGRHVPNKELRRTTYLQFIKRPDVLNSTQDGVYHSLDVVLNDVKVKVIFLDTRSFRDDHWIRSLGEYPVKGSALVASAIRAAYSTLGFARQYAGQMLGEAQWEWLDRTLEESKQQGTDAHILVSSVQVLTTNPVFESWGHFPIEKKRLFDLLKKHDPNGLVMISGDVHLAEIGQARFKRADGSVGTWTEVTSSGLTHTCADGISGLLCPFMMAIPWFAQHRRAGTSHYLGRNFGTIQAEADDAGRTVALDFQIHPIRPSAAASSGAQVIKSEPKLSHRILLPETGVLSVDAGHSDRMRSAIVDVSYPDYFKVPPVVTILLLLALILGLHRVWKAKSCCKGDAKKAV